MVSRVLLVLAGPLRRLFFALPCLLLIACAAPASSADRPPLATPFAAPATPALPVPPPRGKAALVLSSRNSPAKVAECVDRGIARLKVPAGFVQREKYADGGASVRLSIPAGAKNGPEILITPLPGGSQVSLYNNGMVLSAKWHAMIRNCAA